MAYYTHGLERLDGAPAGEYNTCVPIQDGYNARLQEVWY